MAPKHPHCCTPVKYCISLCNANINCLLKHQTYKRVQVYSAGSSLVVTHSSNNRVQGTKNPLYAGVAIRDLTAEVLYGIGDSSRKCVVFWPRSASSGLSLMALTAAMYTIVGNYICRSIYSYRPWETVRVSDTRANGRQACTLR